MTTRNSRLGVASPALRTYHIYMMSVHWNSKISVVLIALHLAIVLAPHTAHADETISGTGSAELHQHMCGAKEIHRDIKDHGDCLLCSRTTYFAAFVVHAPYFTGCTVQYLAVNPDATPFSVTLASTRFLRGPPSIQ